MWPVLVPGSVLTHPGTTQELALSGLVLVFLEVKQEVTVAHLGSVLA